ncbi:thiol peroxidase [Uruburuella testudinis]|uniref:Thiol peroxidase n=1 Tax=Uruburuella testudinis TaxID=1282863 RepID=A0ABY4DZS9_9NEIS|nr:thiol peroxidase [Uruburuella testudinis]UOO83082.1 thiol peroxidase [Uruburuella testudinis]
MSQVTLQGKPVEVGGTFLAAGQSAPDFTLTANDLSDKTLADFSGKRKIMNIFPSVDTGVCAKSVRTFNEKAAALDNTAVLCISADLPFAQARFCGAEGIDNVTMLSSFRSSFARDYGVSIDSSGMRGLNARAVVVLDENNRVLHSELVGEIANEPDYEAALAVLG